MSGITITGGLSVGSGLYIEGAGSAPPPPPPSNGIEVEYSLPSAGLTVNVPLESYFPTSLNAVIDWGDGNTTTATTSNVYSHVYSTSGTKTVTITGTVPRFGTNSGFDNMYITRINSWGDVGLLNIECPLGLSGYSPNFVYMAEPPASITSYAALFFGATSYNDANITTWNTSNVVNFTETFKFAESFNQDISDWNTSNVLFLTDTFNGAQSFNQNINSWDTSNVINMQQLFTGAIAFNQDLNSWVTSNVTNMSGVFAGSGFPAPMAFNGNISLWDVGNVTVMNSMFTNCANFNQDISGWNTANLTSMAYMFQNATSFNQDLSGWVVANVEIYTDFDIGATSWASENKPNFPV